MVKRRKRVYIQHSVVQIFWNCARRRTHDLVPSTRVSVVRQTSVPCSVGLKRRMRNSQLVVPRIELEVLSTMLNQVLLGFGQVLVQSTSVVLQLVVR